MTLMRYCVILILANLVLSSGTFFLSLAKDNQQTPDIPFWKRFVLSDKPGPFQTYLQKLILNENEQRAVGIITPYTEQKKYKFTPFKAFLLSKQQQDFVNQQNRLDLRDKITEKYEIDMSAEQDSKKVAISPFRKFLQNIFFNDNDREKLGHKKDVSSYKKWLLSKEQLETNSEIKELIDIPKPVFIRTFKQLQSKQYTLEKVKNLQLGAIDLWFKTETCELKLKILRSLETSQAFTEGCDHWAVKESKGYIKVEKGNKRATLGFKTTLFKGNFEEILFLPEMKKIKKVENKAKKLLQQNEVTETKTEISISTEYTTQNPVFVFVNEEQILIKPSCEGVVSNSMWLKYKKKELKYGDELILTCNEQITIYNHGLKFKSKQLNIRVLNNIPNNLYNLLFSFHQETMFIEVNVKQISYVVKTFDNLILAGERINDDLTKFEQVYIYWHKKNIIMYTDCGKKREFFSVKNGLFSVSGPSEVHGVTLLQSNCGNIYLAMKMI